MLHAINKYFLKTGVCVKISLFSAPCNVLLADSHSLPAFQWEPIQELIPFSSKCFPCMEKAGWPTPFLRGNSDCCKWSFLLFFHRTINEWRGSKSDGCNIHHLYYSRFMLWLKYLKVVLCVLGTTHSRMPTHFCIFTPFLLCILGLLMKLRVFEEC